MDKYACSTYLLNTFSINMLSENDIVVAFKKVSASEAQKLLKRGPYPIVNAIGHADTDRLVRAELGLELPEGSRVSVTIRRGDNVIIAQYRGPRLPEGATKLPEESEIEYWKANTLFE